MVVSLVRLRPKAGHPRPVGGFPTPDTRSAGSFSDSISTNLTRRFD
jgi:hypothetical protein